MQRGFTLLELLITMVIMVTTVAAVVLSMPSPTVRQAEQEEMRLAWVIQEAHVVAQRYRKTLAIEPMPRGNGYFVAHLPPSLTDENWAQPHQCDCLFAREDSPSPNAPLLIEPNALPPHYQWRIRVGESTRTLQFPDHAP